MRNHRLPFAAIILDLNVRRDDVHTRLRSRQIRRRIGVINPRRQQQQDSFRLAHVAQIKFDGVSVGDLKSYGDDRIELRLRGLSREKRDDILHQIERMLQKK